MPGTKGHLCHKREKMNEQANVNTEELRQGGGQRRRNQNFTTGAKGDNSRAEYSGVHLLSQLSGKRGVHLNSTSSRTAQDVQGDPGPTLKKKVLLG